MHFVKKHFSRSNKGWQSENFTKGTKADTSGSKPDSVIETIDITKNAETEADDVTQHTALSDLELSLDKLEF